MVWSSFCYFAKNYGKFFSQLIFDSSFSFSLIVIIVFFIFVTKNPSKITSMQYNSKLIKRWWNMECMEFWICFRQIFSWNWKKNIYWLSSIYKNSWIYGKILRFALKKVSRFLFRPNIKIKDFFFKWSSEICFCDSGCHALKLLTYLSNMPKCKFPCTILTFEICLRKMANCIRNNPSDRTVKFPIQSIQR